MTGGCSYCSSGGGCVECSQDLHCRCPPTPAALAGACQRAKGVYPPCDRASVGHADGCFRLSLCGRITFATRPSAEQHNILPRHSHLFCASLPSHTKNEACTWKTAGAQMLNACGHQVPRRSSPQKFRAGFVSAEPRGVNISFGITWAATQAVGSGKGTKGTNRKKMPI